MRRFTRLRKAETLLWAGLAVTLFSTGCRADAPPPQTQSAVVWKAVGSWSGRGDKQTETFTSDTGGFRVHWETAKESPAGSGRLRVVFRSGDSGREIIEAIDAYGAGSFVCSSLTTRCGGIVPTLVLF